MMSNLPHTRLLLHRVDRLPVVAAEDVHELSVQRHARAAETTADPHARHLRPGVRQAVVPRQSMLPLHRLKVVLAVEASETEDAVWRGHAAERPASFLHGRDHLPSAFLRVEPLAGGQVVVVVAAVSSEGVDVAIFSDGEPHLVSLGVHGGSFLDL